MGPDGCDYYNIDSDNGIIITERINGINNSVNNIKDCINLTEEIKCENVSLTKVWLNNEKVYSTQWTLSLIR